MSASRSLRDLSGVGPATLRDMRLLGIESVEQRVACDGGHLYRRLCDLTGVRHNPWGEDVLRCAVAQARDPRLSAKQSQRWYWSRLRKAESGDRP